MSPGQTRGTDRRCGPCSTSPARSLCCCGACTWCRPASSAPSAPDLRRLLGTALRNRLAGLRCRHRRDRHPAEQHRDRPDGGRFRRRRRWSTLVPALAVMLGANVGTTLIVQVLSFDVAEVAPALILIGVLLFRRGTATRTRDLGRVAIGLGLMLMALQQLRRPDDAVRGRAQPAHAARRDRHPAGAGRAAGRRR